MALFCTFSLQKTNHRDYKTISNKRPLLKNQLEDPLKKSRKKIVDWSTIGVRTVCTFCHWFFFVKSTYLVSNGYIQFCSNIGGMYIPPIIHSRLRCKSLLSLFVKIAFRCGSQNLAGIPFINYNLKYKLGKTRYFSQAGSAKFRHVLH